MRCHSGRTGKSKQAKTVCQQTERHTGNADCPMQGTMGTGAEDQLGPGSGWNSRCCSGTRRDQTSAKSWLPITTVVPREQQECGCHPWLGARWRWSQASAWRTTQQADTFSPSPPPAPQMARPSCQGNVDKGRLPPLLCPQSPVEAGLTGSVMGLFAPDGRKPHGQSLVTLGVGHMRASLGQSESQPSLPQGDFVHLTVFA